MLETPGHSVPASSVVRRFGKGFGKDAVDEPALALVRGQVLGGIADLYVIFGVVFLRTSLWTSGGLTALVLFVNHVLGLPGRMHPPALVFFSAMFIYNLDHFLDARRSGEVKTPNTRKLSAAQQNELAWHRSRLAALIVVGSGIIGAILAAMAPLSAQIVFAGYATVGVVYSWPILPFRVNGGWRFRAVKEVPGIKGFVVTSALVAGVLVLPVVWAGHPMDASVVLLGAFLFCFIFTNAQMFDVRDVLEDASRGVPTIPCTVGVRRTRHGLLVLNMLVLAGLSWSWSGGTVAPHPEVVVSMAATVAYLLVFDVDLHRDLYAIFIDGCLFLPAALMIGHAAGH